MKGMIEMAMGVNGLKSYNFSSVKGSSTSSKATSISKQEKANRYFKKLQEEYSGINLKKNDINVNDKYEITVSLSPKLISKAIKDPEVDKSIRQMLKDLKENKGKLKSCNCSKSGHEVMSVGFLIDEKQNISCSIKLKNRINKQVNGKDNKKAISLLIDKQKKSFEKNKNTEKSLCYRYLKLLSENKFASLDFTV